MLYSKNTVNLPCQSVFQVFKSKLFDLPTEAETTLQVGIVDIKSHDLKNTTKDKKKNNL